MATNAAQHQIIATALATDGYAVVADYFARAEWLALRDTALALHRTQSFHAAGIGRGAQLRQREDVRNDDVCWLDANSDNAAVQHWFARVEQLRYALNETLYLGVFDFESHFAVYPSGHFYRRHIDVFQGTSARVVTLIAYLNDDWRPEHGGALRLYLDEDHARDILPVGGTLVAFLSDRFYHEVLPATRERLSVTGWLRRRAAS